MNDYGRTCSSPSDGSMPTTKNKKELKTSCNEESECRGRISTPTSRSTRDWSSKRASISAIDSASRCSPTDYPMTYTETSSGSTTPGAMMNGRMPPCGDKWNTYIAKTDANSYRGQKTPSCTTLS